MAITQQDATDIITAAQSYDFNWGLLYIKRRIFDETNNPNHFGYEEVNAYLQKRLTDSKAKYIHGEKERAAALQKLINAHRAKNSNTDDAKYTPTEAKADNGSGNITADAAVTKPPLPADNNTSNDSTTTTLQFKFDKIGTQFAVREDLRHNLRTTNGNPDSLQIESPGKELTIKVNNDTKLVYHTGFRGVEITFAELDQIILELIDDHRLDYEATIQVNSPFFTSAGPKPTSDLAKVESKVTNKDIQWQHDGAALLLPDHRVATVTDNGKRIYIINPITGEQQKFFAAPCNAIGDLFLVQDKALGVVLESDDEEKEPNRAEIYDLKTRKLLHKFPLAAYANSCFSLRTGMIATYSKSDNAIRVYDPTKGTLVAEFAKRVHESEPKDREVAIAENGTIAIAYAQNVHIYDTATGKLLKSFQTGFNIGKITFLKDGNLAITNDNPCNSIAIFDSEGSLIEDFEILSHKWPAFITNLENGAIALYSRDLEPGVNIYNAENGEHLYAIDATPQSTCALQFVCQQHLATLATNSSLHSAETAAASSSDANDLSDTLEEDGTVVIHVPTRLNV